MTKSPLQKRLERQETNRIRHMELETMTCILMVKFPKGTLQQVGFSLLKERMIRALKNEFGDAEVVI